LAGLPHRTLVSAAVLEAALLLAAAAALALGFGGNATIELPAIGRTDPRVATAALLACLVAALAWHLRHTGWRGAGHAMGAAACLAGFFIVVGVAGAFLFAPLATRPLPLGGFIGAYA